MKLKKVTFYRNMHIDQVIYDVKSTAFLLLSLAIIGFIGTLLFWEYKSLLDSILKLGFVIGSAYFGYILWRSAKYLQDLRSKRKH